MYTANDYKMKNALIETVIDNLPSAIILLDNETSIVLANKVAELFSNKSRINLYGRKGGDAFGCIHANDNSYGCGYGDACRTCVIRNTVEKTLLTKTNLENVEASMTFTDKGDRTLSVSTTWLDSNELVIVALTDVTDLKQQEQLKLEHVRLQAAVNTIGAICHEMNQPLAVITGYIELLNMGVDTAEETTKYMDEIHSQAIRLGGITRKLMSINSFREMQYANGSILDITRSSNGKGN